MKIVVANIGVEELGRVQENIKRISDEFFSLFNLSVRSSVSLAKPSLNEYNINIRLVYEDPILKKEKEFLDTIRVYKRGKSLVFVKEEENIFTGFMIYAVSGVTKDLDIFEGIYDPGLDMVKNLDENVMMEKIPLEELDKVIRISYSYIMSEKRGLPFTITVITRKAIHLQVYKYNPNSSDPVGTIDLVADVKHDFSNLYVYTDNAGFSPTIKQRPVLYVIPRFDIVSFEKVVEKF